jgi:hypothetical protein
MLTGIYVSATTTLTFQTTETVTLVCYDSSKPAITATGSPLQATVGQGIYKVLTNDTIHTATAPTTAGNNISVFECPSVKDPTPDPPAFATTNHLYTTMSSLGAFFVQPDGRSMAFPTSAR